MRARCRKRAGDSWSEGTATTPGTDNSFPAQLSRRLTRGWIVNQGISGNRLLTDEIGDRYPAHGQDIEPEQDRPDAVLLADMI